MNFLTEWEDNSVSNGINRKFEMIYPMRINLLDQDFHFRERLPDRYNTKDNIYQYFQNIGGELMIYALLGMIERKSRFLVVGKVPESNVWPVFACALDNISASGALIGLVTFFTDYAEKMIKKQKFCRGNFFATGSNYVEGHDNPLQQVIISEPYSSENQFDGIYDKGNMMDAFCRVNVNYNLSGVYLDREKECFGNQGGYSARGFIKKAWGGIVNAILSKKIEKGSQFRIKSCGQTPFYCLLRYDGAVVKTKTVFFTAISVSTNENDSAAAPIISRIDKGQNFVSSKEIENRRKDQIRQIDSNILDKNSNFEQGEDFKMSDNYKDDRYETKKMAEALVMNKIEKLIAESFKNVLENKKKEHMKIAEEKLKSIISEAIKESLQPQPIGLVKNPIGYNCSPEWVWNNILHPGFSVSKSNLTQVYGDGFYFLRNGPDKDWRRCLGNSVIKAVVRGKYPVYENGGYEFFVVPYEQENNIKIIDDSENGGDNTYGDKWASSVSKPLNESELKSLISEAIMSVISEEGIHIKDQNKGKFNATKEKTGKSTEELTHSKNPITKKRAIFAQNAKKWNKK